MKRIILYSIAIALGVALYATSPLDFLPADTDQLGESSSRAEISAHNSSSLGESSSSGKDRQPSSERASSTSSLSYYIQEKYDKAFETLQKEMQTQALNDFQIQKSLDRLPVLFAKVSEPQIKIALSKFSELLQLFENNGAQETRMRAKQERVVVLELMEMPSFQSLMNTSENLKQRSQDEAPFLTDLKRTAFLKWSDAYAQRKWSETLKQPSPTQQNTMDSGLEWLYYSGFAAYQGMAQGGPQLREFILRCGTRKTGVCQYVKNAQTMVNILEGVDGPKSLSKDQ